MARLTMARSAALPRPASLLPVHAPAFRREVTHAPDLTRREFLSASDRALIIEAEDLRDECAPRYWDDDSPPYYGINRVAVRSTLTPGRITVTAIRKGLEPATVHIRSHRVPLVHGISRYLPHRFPIGRKA
jgi:hypothetical protein